MSTVRRGGHRCQAEGVGSRPSLSHQAPVHTASSDLLGLHVSASANLQWTRPVSTKNTSLLINHKVLKLKQGLEHSGSQRLLVGYCLLKQVEQAC